MGLEQRGLKTSVCAAGRRIEESMNRVSLSDLQETISSSEKMKAMSTITQLFRFAIISLLVGLLPAGCGSGNGSLPVLTPPNHTRAVVGPLQLELTTARTVYKRGEPVNVQLRVTNISNDKVTLYYYSVDYNRTVTYKGAAIYGPDGYPGTPRAYTVVYDPGQARSYDILPWDQTATILDPTGQTILNKDGKAVSGDYQVQVLLRAGLTPYSPSDPASGEQYSRFVAAPLTIRIE